MSYQIIKPKVEIVDYGPKLLKDTKRILNPDQVVALSSMITYNNQDIFQNLARIEKEDTNLEDTLKKSIVASTGRGHASMSTMPVLWIMFQNCSKMVDSMFTGARFSTSLMPSGRRTGISKDQIVVPEDIAKSSKEIQRSYTETSEKNIEVYEKLLTRNIKQDVASKIVQYGINGGGFMCMPLETIIGFALDFEQNKEAVPKESLEIIKQIEEKMFELGMEKNYSARKNAARAPYPNPNIFKFSDNYISNLLKNQEEILKNPQIINIKYLSSIDREKSFEQFNTEMVQIFSDPNKIKENWRRLLIKRKNLVDSYNSTIEVHMASTIPWRVWGEVKRHRTMPQNVESIYLAINRAKEKIYLIKKEIKNSNLLFKIKEIEKIISLPNEIKSNKENLELWFDAFYNSLKAYDFMTNNGIKKSDAIQVIPRGIKLGVEKVIDLYNLTNGYYPLRLCGTAEEEMRKNTEYEVYLIKKSNISEQIKNQIIPKCGYIGFCLEPWKKCCHRIDQFVHFKYTKEVHDFFDDFRKKAIEMTINNLGSKDINLDDMEYFGHS